MVYAQNKQYERALQITKLEALSSIERRNSSPSLNIVEAVSRQAAQSEAPAQAVKVLDAALERVKAIRTSPSSRIEAIAAISSQYAAIGQPDKASDLLAQSLKLVSE